jgi:hypothetical protein
VLTPALAAAVAAVVILLIQVGAVRPRLTRRSDRILAGDDAPRSRSHYAYIPLEAAKVAALIVTGVLLLFCSPGAKMPGRYCPAPVGGGAGWRSRSFSSGSPCWLAWLSALTRLAQHLVDLAGEFAWQVGRACSCAPAVTSIRNRASPIITAELARALTGRRRPSRFPADGRAGAYPQP